MHNLFLFLHLLTSQTKGKEPLVDYSQSHVVTSYQKLNIMSKKMVDTATAIFFGEERWKEKEKKKFKRKAYVGSTMDRVAKITIEK